MSAIAQLEPVARTRGIAIVHAAYKAEVKALRLST